MTRTLARFLPIFTRHCRFTVSSLATPLLLSLLLHVTSSQNAYEKATDQIFKPSGPQGFPAALWDTNQDRLTDLILWNKSAGGDKIQIYASKTTLQQKHPVLEKSGTEVTLPDQNQSIVSVIPGDFDGDFVLDLVIVTTPTTSTADTYRLYVSWGSQNPNTKGWILESPALPVTGSDDAAVELVRQPTVLDFDANTVPDLLVQLKNDNSIRRLLVKDLGSHVPGVTRRKWIMVPWNELSSYTKESSYVLTPHSNAFIDINGDLMADLILTMKAKDGGYLLVVAEHNDFEPSVVPDEMPFKKVQTIGLNSTTFGEFKEIGQISFVDFDNDQRVDAIIPVVHANGNTSLWLFDWATNSFKDISPNWEGHQILPADGQAGVPLRIHLGDYDQDGYVDGVAVVIKDGAKQVALLKNDPTSSDPESQDKNRKFTLDLTKTGNINGDVRLASFFDAYDDGFLDILVMTSTNEGNQIDCFQNQLGIDATWIKAMVYTGFCGQLSGPGEAFPECSDDSSKLALSLPVVGASVTMNTTRGDGKQQSVAAGLLTQLTHFSLQMPTTIFGLGRSPNFVDRIAIGLSPVLNHTTGDAHSKVFEQTIPNSAVVINPHPLTQPSQWRAFIYVTPSSAMLETGIVLSVVFALLAILVGLLHLKEKREDQKEKLVEMQRFHFDAM